MTHKHDDRAILTRSAPVLCWVRTIARPVGLKCTNEDKCRITQRVHTLMPQRKGDMLIPYTGSWLISRISLFNRMDSMSGAMADNCEYTMSNGKRSNPKQITFAPISKGDFMRAHTVKCDFASSYVSSPLPLYLCQSSRSSA